MSHRPILRRTRTLAATVALGAALAGCAGAEEASEAANGTQDSACPVAVDESTTGPVRIAYQAIPNADLLVKDKGWLEACAPGATITWNRFDSGGDVVQAFGARSIDIGLLGSSPATRALSAPLEIPMKVVWIHDVIGASESLAARDTTVQSIADLEGARIGVPFSSTAHFSLMVALREAGMDPTTDVSLINLSPDSILGAWQGGDIDAAWVWDPVLSQLLDSGVRVTGSDETADAGSPTFDLGGATEAFIEANPAFMEVWTAVQDHAVQMLAEDAEGSATSIAVELGVTPDVVAQQLEGYRYLTAEEQAGADYFGGGLAEALSTTAQFLHGEGEIAAVNTGEAYRAGTYSAAVDAVAGE